MEGVWHRSTWKVGSSRWRGGASGGKVVIDKIRASAALAKLEREATSPDTPEIIAAFRNLLSLN